MASAAPSKLSSSEVNDKKSSSSEVVESSRSTNSESSVHEDIARLAYALWQERGAPEGSPERDWREAEQQILRSEPKSTVIGR